MPDAISFFLFAAFEQDAHKHQYENTVTWKQNCNNIFTAKWKNLNTFFFPFSCLKAKWHQSLI